MSTKIQETAVGVFVDYAHAEQAIKELRDAGFASDRIGFIADDPAKMVSPPADTGTKAGKDAAIGATVGSVLGATVGMVAAAVIAPMAGPVIAGGLLAVALGGAVAGGASGGVFGALIGLNVPEEEARHYEQQFHSGRSLVTVHAGNRYEEAVAILRRAAEQWEQPHAQRRIFDQSSDRGPANGVGSVVIPPL